MDSVGLLKGPVLAARSPAPANGTTRNCLIMFRLREARFRPGCIRRPSWGFFNGPSVLVCIVSVPDSSDGQQPAALGA
jgi:hypothetical protein